MKKNLLLLLSAIVLLPWCVSAQTFPTLSQAGNDTWYSIYSHRAGLVLKDNGAGNEVTTADLEEATEAEIDALKWKFLATGETIDGAAVFKIVSKLGNELYYEQFQDALDNDGEYWYDEDDEVYKTSESSTGDLKNYDRFLTKAGSSENTFIFKQYNADAGFTFQIWAIDVKHVIDPEPGEDEIAGSYINKTNNDEDICIYHVDNDGGNPFSAITSMDDIYAEKYTNAPLLSTSSSPVWYQILSMRSGKVFANAGYDTPVAQQDAAIGASLEKDAQLYRFEGTYSKFKVISKTDGELAHVSSPDNRIIIAETGDFFRFEPTPQVDYSGKWALVHVEKGTGINETSNTACLYGINDNGSVVDFIADDFNWFEGAPELSTASAPKWYALKNCRAERVLTNELGFDQLLFTKTLIEEAGEEQDKQLFRFEGEYESFKIISKSENYLKATTSSWTIPAADPEAEPIQITDALRIIVSEEGDDFTFSRSTNAQYGGSNAWIIKNLITTGSNGNAINANNGKEYEVTLYGSGDGGSVWEFIRAEDIGGGDSFVPQIDANLRAQLFVSANTLTVKAENMSSIAIYNITGAKIMSSTTNNSSFEYTMPTAGYYVVSVTYSDAKTENIKFIVK